MKLTEAKESYLQHIRVEKGLSSNTLMAYERDLEKYFSFLASKGIDENYQVKQSDIRSFLQFLSGNGFQPSSNRRVLSSVRNFHHFCVIENIEDSNPAADIVAPKIFLKLPDYLTLEQIGELLEACKDQNPILALRDVAVVELLYSSGIRVSELCSLHVDDFTMASQNRLMSVIGKGNKERLVPIGSYAIKSVEEYLKNARPFLAAKGKGDTHIFLNQRGKRLSRQSVWEIIQNAVKRHKLPLQLTPHTLRHTFATHLIEGGADVRVVQELLGHASVSTTQIYTHVSATQLDEVFYTTHPRA